MNPISKDCAEPTVLLLKNGYGEYSIQIPGSDHTLTDVMDDVVIPLLKAAGYSDMLIKRYFGEED